jgi:hypothetical protein
MSSSWKVTKSVWKILRRQGSIHFLGHSLDSPQDRFLRGSLLRHVAVPEKIVSVIAFVYTGQNPRWHIVSVKTSQMRTNIYADLERILPACLYLHVSFYPAIVNFCRYAFPHSTGKIQICYVAGSIPAITPRYVLYRRKIENALRSTKKI